MFLARPNLQRSQIDNNSKVPLNKNASYDSIKISFEKKPNKITIYSKGFYCSRDDWQNLTGTPEYIWV